MTSESENSQSPKLEEPSNLTTPERISAFTLFCLGDGPKEIAEKLGTTSERIRNWICRGRWSDFLQSARATQKHVPVTQQPVIRSVIEEGEAIREKYQRRMGKVADRFSEHVEGMDMNEFIKVAPKLEAANRLNRANLNMDGDDKDKRAGQISVNVFSGNATKFVKVIDQGNEPIEAEVLPLPEPEPESDQ